MSREIKFRAWDIIDKKMHKQKRGFYEDGEYDGCWYVAMFRLRDLSNSEEYVLMQYTGLKDKNGVEIYEGDIIKQAYSNPHVHNTHDLFEVRFGVYETGYDSSSGEYGDVEVKTCGFHAHFKDGDIELNYDDLSKFETWEVVGNIYENPELLEGPE